MGKYASEFVKQAKAWLNKKESDGSHKEIIDIYNNFNPRARGYKVKYTDAWCATFVSAVSIKLGYTSIIPTECSCEKMIDLFKKLGCFIENENRTPNVGEIVFYDWQDNGKGDNKGYSDHVGIVSNVSRETFTVIEGNYNNSVKERMLNINGKYIRGFAVPKFDAEPVSKPSEPLKSISEVAKECIHGLWGNGQERKERLEKAGYDYERVQTYINAIYNKEETHSKTISEVAKEVIDGKWGNGYERKSRLKKAGYDYELVQNHVNALLMGR